MREEGTAPSPSGRLQRESKRNATSNERFQTFRRLEFWLIKCTKRQIKLGKVVCADLMELIVKGATIQDWDLFLYWNVQLAAFCDYCFW